MYSDRDKELLRTTSLTEVLRDLGKNPRHTRSGLYYSPFHEEKTPSFHIDEEKHAWYDHGMRNPAQKAGGDVFDLVMMLKGCSFSEACDYLKGFNPAVRGEREEDIIDIGTSPSRGRCTIRVDKVYDYVASPLLLEYATSRRHIPKDILNKYCNQVNYTNVFENGATRDRFAIGFRNINMDWALRGVDPEVMKPKQRKQKYSTGQNFTAIGADGEFIMKDDLVGKRLGGKALTVIVFEGFTNFLSWLAWKGRMNPETCDVVVLNTTKNTLKAIDFIAAHDKVIAYLDNDETGTQTTEYMKQLLEEHSDDSREIEFFDGRFAYSNFNDLNDAWIDRHRKIQMAEFKAKTEPPGKKIEEQSTPKLTRH